MQRKTLNIYLYRTEHQFKLRFIEMQVIEEPPQVRDDEIFKLLSGVEETFALSLSNALDNFNHSFVRNSNLKQSQLFQRFCPSYEREIVTDAANPSLRYTFHNIDWLLFDSRNLADYQTHTGDETDLMMQLGAFDDAVTSFTSNAHKDGYAVAVQYIDHPPELDDKVKLVGNAFTAAPADLPVTALSRHIVSWMANHCKIKSVPEQSFAHNNLQPLLESEENSLKNAVHRSIYIKPPAQPSPQPFCLFAHDIRAGEKISSAPLKREYR